MIPLKEAIAENHTIAEKTIFSQRMLKGELSKREYYMYLVQELCIFAKIEKRYALPHKSLHRVNKINLDLIELSNQLLYEKSDTEMNYLKSTMDYAGYLGTLWGDELMPHMYVNYLKLLYGGQIIKKCIPGGGLFYDFEYPGDAIASIRTLQRDEWADEANKGLVYNINMLNELQRVFG
jgi:heme oxygenase